ncbi:MAG: response regulator [Roseivirga sp.]|nr:response regulator [Roseivirga sp.]
MDKEGLKIEIELLEESSLARSKPQKGQKPFPDVLLAVPTAEIRSQLSSFIGTNYPQWSLRHAGDALEAYARLEQKPADLIICEFCMPYLSGFGFMKKLNADAALKHIPLVMISAEPIKEIMDTNIRLLSDPFNQEELRTVLRQVIA